MARTITANYLSGLPALTNTGDSPLSINSGVTISAASGNAVQSAVAFGWTVSNAGQVRATAGDGMAFTQLASLSNAASGVISGYGFGVSAHSAGTVINQGSISQTGTTTPGYVFGPPITVTSAAVYLTGGAITNLGGSIRAVDLGVAIGGGGTVTNSGGITSTSEFGVLVTTGGQVTNQSGGSIYGGRYGVTSYGALGVSNASGGTISGGSSGVLNIYGSDSITNAGLLKGNNFGVDLQSGVATVVNSGSLVGISADGAALTGGGYVSNQTGGLIGGGNYGVIISGGGGKVVNQAGITGTSQAAVALLAGGYVDNLAGGQLRSSGDGVFINGAVGTLANAGQIGVVGGVGQNVGVYLKSGGSITNTGTGLIAGYAFGAAIGYGVGAITNSGTIASYKQSPGSGAFNSDGVLLASGGTLTNAASGVIGSKWIGVQVGTSSASLVSASSTVVNYGIINAADTLGDGAALWLAGPATVINNVGAVIAPAGATAGGFGIVAYGDATVINRGSVGGSSFSLIEPMGTGVIKVEIAPGASFQSTVMGASSTTTTLGTLELLSASSRGTISGIGTKYQRFGGIVIDTGARWSMSGTIANGTTLSGFVTGNTLSLSAMTGVTSATFASGGTLQVTGSISGTAGTLSLPVTGVSNAAGLGTLLDANGNVISVACFAAGTRIATPSGQVAVERLVAGAQVLTDDGGAAPIVWLGRRLIDCAAHPQPEKVWPVRVRAGAFGVGMPARDLYLSPDHAVFADGILVPVKLLVNGSSIMQVQRGSVEYFHLELPRHALVRAEGLMVESYLDIGDRDNFANGAGATRLFADFSTRSPDIAALWEAKGCAPLVISGPALTALRRRLMVDDARRLAS